MFRYTAATYGELIQLLPPPSLLDFSFRPTVQLIVVKNITVIYFNNCIQTRLRFHVCLQSLIIRNSRRIIVSAPKLHDLIGIDNSLVQLDKHIGPRTSSPKFNDSAPLLISNDGFRTASGHLFHPISIYRTVAPILLNSP